MKKCTKCKTEKPFSEFHKAKETKDGLRTYCKACTRAISKTWQEANAERVKANVETWQEANRDKVREIAKRQREKYPKKRAARLAVSRAIRSGRLVKAKHCCINNERCSGRVEAHHDDYDQPLEVTWFCVSHHKEWHKLFVPAGA